MSTLASPNPMSSPASAIAEGKKPASKPSAMEVDDAEKNKKKPSVDRDEAADLSVLNGIEKEEVKKLALQVYHKKVADGTIGDQDIQKLVKDAAQTVERRDFCLRNTKERSRLASLGKEYEPAKLFEDDQKRKEAERAGELRLGEEMCANKDPGFKGDFEKPADDSEPIWPGARYTLNGVEFVYTFVNLKDPDKGLSPKDMKTAKEEAAEVAKEECEERPEMSKGERIDYIENAVKEAVAENEAKRGWVRLCEVTSAVHPDVIREVFVDELIGFNEIGIGKLVDLCGFNVENPYGRHGNEKGEHYFKYKMMMSEIEALKGTRNFMIENIDERKMKFMMEEAGGVEKEDRESSWGATTKLNKRAGYSLVHKTLANRILMAGKHVREHLMRVWNEGKPEVHHFLHHPADELLAEYWEPETEKQTARKERVAAAAASRKSGASGEKGPRKKADKLNLDVNNLIAKRKKPILERAIQAVKKDYADESIKIQALLSERQFYVSLTQEVLNGFVESVDTAITAQRAKEPNETNEPNEAADDAGDALAEAEAEVMAVDDADDSDDSDDEEKTQEGEGDGDDEVAATDVEQDPPSPMDS